MIIDPHGNATSGLGFDKMSLTGLYMVCINDEPFEMLVLILDEEFILAPANIN